MRKLSAYALFLALTLAPMTSHAVVVELIQNGGLENWTAGAPDNWDMTDMDEYGTVNASPDYTINQETSDLHAGTAGSIAMRQDRNTADYTYRYWAHTNGFNALVSNATFSGWMKGGSQRAFRGISTDSGATWTVDNTSAFGGFSGSTGWTHVTATIATMQTAGEMYRISFHSFLAESNYVDDISLIGDDGTVPATPAVGSITPDPVMYLTRTVNLVVVPTGGSGTYTQVEFDINNDGNVEKTDTSAPYEYTWDTQADQPGRGVVSVKITVTDNTSATGSEVFDYTVDNRGYGRVEIGTNSDFDSWQAVVGSNQLPVDWVELQPNANATYGQSDDNPDALSTPSLQVTFATFDNTNRYTLRHIGKQNLGALWEDHQVNFWGKGNSCALKYWKSADGVTWEDTGLTAGSAGSPDWLYAIGTVAPLVSETLNGWSTITTVNQAGTVLFDKIHWIAIQPTVGPQPPVSGATGSWRLYD